jgi:MFS family permease
MKAWLSDLTDDENRATVFGIESGLMSISQIIGPIFGGFLYISQGMEFLFFIAIGINIINIFLLSTLRFRSKFDDAITELLDDTSRAIAGN